MLKLTTLGGWGLAPQGGSPAELDSGPSKSLAVVAYLACSPGVSARRETLLDMLWSHREPDAADHALRQTIWHLRRRFGESFITSSEGRITLSDVRSDRSDFLHAIEEEAFGEAVALYRGDFLPGFAAPGGNEFEIWADVERRRLHTYFLLACDNHARDHLSHGRWREAVAVAKRARDADALSEAPWRLLMECLLASGDGISAHVEAEALRRMLEAEGREPEKATAAIIRRAVEGPTVRPPAASFTTEFVARESQFAEIANAWRDVHDGRGRHVHVWGAAGMGKTRLLHEVAVRLGSMSITPVLARANQGERLIPYAFAAELATSLAKVRGATGISPATASTLVALNPRLSSTFLGAPSTTPSRADIARVFALAMEELIECVADEGPIAILLDDLHWADAQSVALLEAVLQRVSASSVLLLTAARPGIEGRLQRSDTTRIELEAFAAHQVALLLTTIGTLPDAEWAAELPNALTRYAQGSPLLTIEALRLALNHGLLILRDGRWESGDPVGLFSLLTAGGALRKRITELDRDKTWLLTLLATAGVPLHLQLLARAAARPEQAVAEDLEQLDRIGMTMRQGNLWSPSHDEFADLVLELTSREARVAAHAATARALLERGEDTDLIHAARHLSSANQPRELQACATRWLERARSAGDDRGAEAIVTDLLGASLPRAEIPAMVRALPWRLRFGARQRRFAVGGIAIVAGIAAFAGWRSIELGGPGLVVGLWVPDSSGTSRLHTHVISARDMARGLIALESTRPTDIRSWGWQHTVVRPGVPHQWAASRAHADSGGVDVVLGDGRRSPRRLTRRPGDDWTGSWSPDGRLLAIATDRWSNSSKTAIAIMDPDRPDNVVRLTWQRGNRDVAPFWSPDGTRIAFDRTWIDPPGASELCYVSVDGVALRCVAPIPGLRFGTLVGWGAAHEVIGHYLDSAGGSRILALNIVSGTHRELVQGEPISSSTAAGWFACVCRRTDGEPYQNMILGSNDSRTALRLPSGEPPAVELMSLATDRYLDRLEIGIPREVPNGHTALVRVNAWDRGGRPVEPLALRWESSDTAIATVSTDGLVTGRREGAVVIRTTAGGWRSATQEITIGRPLHRDVIEEDWRGALTTRWVPYGTPTPSLVSFGNRFALATNADSTHSSGVLSIAKLATNRGAGVEVSMSLRLTAPQWQWLGVSLVGPTASERAAWDLAIGHVEIPMERWRSCGFSFPERVSENPGDRVSLTGGLQRSVPMQAHAAAGQWVTFRLQYFPDGRCGLAINGKAAAIIDRPVTIGDSVIVLIRSVAHRTRALVGPLTAWTGVRGDVDWEAITSSKPPR